MGPKRPSRSAALCLTLAALAAPGTAAAAQDLRSPDARGAGVASAPRGTDLRTPDAQDASKGRGTFNAPDVMVVKLRAPAPAPVAAADGMDWADAGIGAGILLGLGALAFGGALAVTRRHGPATIA